MTRSIILLLALLLACPAAVWAQPYYAPAGRMSQQEATAIAEYWIVSYLRRNPEPAETNQLADQLVRSRSPAQVLAGLLSGREYFDYAGGTQQGWIRQLIEDVGHRQASRYEIEDRLQYAGGQNPQTIAFSFLREFPANWWPGPAATPPRELRHLYQGRW